MTLTFNRLWGILWWSLEAPSITPTQTCLIPQASLAIPSLGRWRDTLSLVTFLTATSAPGLLCHASSQCLVSTDHLAQAGLARPCHTSGGDYLLSSCSWSQTASGTVLVCLTYCKIPRSSHIASTQENWLGEELA